ncbi:MAG TPA: class II aldolase/adducin family protein [Bradyrhizobium sp.]|nr:class II aldolase/adducin family protein [Bradyrhizobium sp.]
MQDTIENAVDIATSSVPKPADGEKALRIQLANFYHLVDHLGWTEMIFNHISVRLPGSEGHYLVNPFGLYYDEITPENLIRVDLFGNIVGRADYPANPAGFALHGAIHGARPDVHCVAHTHTTAVSAIALKRDGFGHDDFYGAQLFGRVSYHAFEGITLFADEKSRMVTSLGDKHVLVLRNHGVAVCEQDIPRTFMLLWTVQRAAEIQCQAGMIPGQNVGLSDNVRCRCSESIEHLIEGASVATNLFDAAVRKMRRERGKLW